MWLKLKWQCANYLKNQYSKIQIQNGTTRTSKEIAMGSDTEEDYPFHDNQLHPQGAYL